MITLYGGRMNRGGRSILALEECGLEYELRDINLADEEHKKPDFLKLNPAGTVPTLVDGDTVVWESMAINFYLADRYGKGLIPATPAGRAQALQWSLWAITALEPHLATVFRHRMMLPENERDPAAADAAAAEATAKMEVLDHGLEGRKWLLGEAFTVADINVGHVAGWARLVGIDMSERGEIQRWMKQLRERPAFATFLG